MCIRVLEHTSVYEGVSAAKCICACKCIGVHGQWAVCLNVNITFVAQYKYTFVPYFQYYIYRYVCYIVCAYIIYGHRVRPIYLYMNFV